MDSGVVEMIFQPKGSLFEEVVRAVQGPPMAYKVNVAHPRQQFLTLIIPRNRRIDYETLHRVWGDHIEVLRCYEWRPQQWEADGFELYYGDKAQ